jgi:hypothetical protein
VDCAGWRKRKAPLILVWDLADVTSILISDSIDLLLIKNIISPENIEKRS